MDLSIQLILAANTYSRPYKQTGKHEQKSQSLINSHALKYTNKSHKIKH
jgi:hypothetical protein